MEIVNNKGCEKCGLCKLRTHIVNGEGWMTNPKILIIGDGPTLEDDAEGLPFRKQVKNALYPILREAGIVPDEVFKTNLIRCVARDSKSDDKKGTRPASEEEIRACFDYLKAEIEFFKPNIIVPMGEGPLKVVMGLKTGRLTKYRGIEAWSPVFNCKVIPTYSPDTLISVPRITSVMLQDFKNIKASSEYPELSTPKPVQYMTIDSLEKFDAAVERLLEAPKFTFDIETSGLTFFKDQILCISFSWAERTAITIPLIRYVGRPEEYTETVMRKIKKRVSGEWVDAGQKEITKTKTRIIDEYYPYWNDKQDYVLGKLKEVFASDIPKIAHNGKFDVRFLRRAGMVVNNYCFDTLLAHFLLDENAQGLHGLKDLSVLFTDMGHYDSHLDNWFKERHIGEEKRNYAHLPTDLLYHYASADADCTLRLQNRFEPELEREGLTTLFERLTMAISHTLMETEIEGVKIDTEYAKTVKAELEAHIQKLEKTLSDHVEELEKKTGKKIGKVNFNSSKQLIQLFFTHLKLPVIKMTEGKTPVPATDESVLLELSKYHAIPKILLEYRKVVKLLTTYVIGILDSLDDKGFCHTTFLIHGTVTGRLSSVDPNLQNIPRADPENPDAWANKIKAMFVPRPGYLFIEADYGQAEFRHWANYSQDPAMLKDLREGVDIHRQTASDLYGVPPSQITKDQRQAAKSIVFGLMYGMQIPKLIKDVKENYGIELTEEQGKKVIRDFFKRYPKAQYWLEWAKNEVYTNEQIRNVFGRIRRLPGIHNHNTYIRSEAERQATNSPIQSAASDMNCNAANRLRFTFEEMGIDAILRLTVHDSLVYEVPKERAQECALIIQREMERPIEGVTAPMISELKMGDRWGTLSSLCTKCCAILQPKEKDLCAECKDKKSIGETNAVTTAS